MPITSNLFLDKFGKVSEYMGWKIPFKRQELIYERCVYFEPADLDIALTKMEMEERFNIKKFMEYMEDSRAGRREREAFVKQQKYDNEAKSFFGDMSGGSATCSRGRKCNNCPRSICKVVSDEVSYTMKLLFRGDITQDQMNRHLATEFPGLGWEDNL